MLGVLLESRARRQRRTGGVATSVATHVALIGVVAAATAHTPRREHEKPVVTILVFPRPAQPRQAVVDPVMRPSAPTGMPVLRAVPILPALAFTPPTVDPSGPPIQNPGEIAWGPPRVGGGLPSIIGSGAEPGGAGSSGVWDPSETLMHLVAAPHARYPEPLRNAGISGRVVIQFVVDTTGRVDMSSVLVLRSSHDLFTRAVRDALPALRFRPTEMNGRRVRALAEMPFEFVLKG
jgi:protein TonB